MNLGIVEAAIEAGECRESLLGQNRFAYGVCNVAPSRNFGRHFFPLCRRGFACKDGANLPHDLVRIVVLESQVARIPHAVRGGGVVFEQYLERIGLNMKTVSLGSEIGEKLARIFGGEVDAARPHFGANQFANGVGIVLGDFRGDGIERLNRLVFPPELREIPRPPHLVIPASHGRRVGVGVERLRRGTLSDQIEHAGELHSRGQAVRHQVRHRVLGLQHFDAIERVLVQQQCHPGQFRTIARCVAIFRGIRLGDQLRHLRFVARFAMAKQTHTEPVHAILSRVVRLRQLAPQARVFANARFHQRNVGIGGQRIEQANRLDAATIDVVRHRERRRRRSTAHPLDFPQRFQLRDGHFPSVAHLHERRVIEPGRCERAVQPEFENFLRTLELTLNDQHRNALPRPVL